MAQKGFPTARLNAGSPKKNEVFQDMVIEEAARGLLIDFSSACKGTRGRMTKCKCLVEWGGVEKEKLNGEMVKGIVDFYKMVRVGGEDTTKAHHRRFVSGKEGKPSNYWKINLEKERVAEVCEIAIFSFFARLPECRKVKSAWKRVAYYNLQVTAGGLWQRKKLRTVFYIVTHYFVHVWNKKMAGGETK